MESSWSGDSGELVQTASCDLAWQLWGGHARLCSLWQRSPELPSPTKPPHPLLGFQDPLPTQGQKAPSGLSSVTQPWSAAGASSPGLRGVGLLQKHQGVV